MTLLKDAECCATEILERHRSEIDSLVDAREARGTLDADEIRRCLDPEAKVTVIAPQVAAGP